MDKIIAILDVKFRTRKKILNLACPFRLDKIYGLPGALPSGQVNKKSCLPSRDIYLPQMTGLFFLFFFFVFCFLFLFCFEP